MLNAVRTLCSFLFTTFLVQSAFATNPMIGAEIGVVVARKLFAAPPLPNLDGGGVTVSVQYGYVDAKSKLSVDGGGGAPIASSGGASGNTGGFGVSIPTKGNYGYFFFGIGNKIRGDVSVTQSGTETYRISNIEADTFSAAGGISYRVIGTDKSFFALAPFIGPYYMQIHAMSDFVPSSSVGGGAPTHFAVDPTMYGLFEGIQLILRMGPLRINPYLLASQDMSKQCRDVRVTGPATPYGCELDGTMVGAGLFLGLGPIRLNVFSMIPESLDLEVTHYSGSLSYEF
jgi:hypothetical protein